MILRSQLADEFEVIHLDTSDHREIDTLGAIDVTNVRLALQHYVELLVLLARHRPDVVYVPISQTTVGYLKDSGFLITSKLLRRRVLCHLRGGFFKEWLSTASLLTRAYVRLVHSRMDGQIVLGESLRHLFGDLLPSERIHVVPNGKDLPPPPARERSPSDPIRVLFLANMVRTKGVLETLQSARLVARESPNVEYVFGGAWDVDPTVRRDVDAFLAAHPDLAVRWLGRVTGDAKASAFAEADVFVFPSYYPPEGHPWVIVEAMAAGLPVVSTDQGAIRESVVDGVNGFIVEKRSAQAVAAAVSRLAQDLELRRRMGRESRRLYEENFTEARMTERLGMAIRRTLER